MSISTTRGPRAPAPVSSSGVASSAQASRRRWVWEGAARTIAAVAVSTGSVGSSRPTTASTAATASWSLSSGGQRLQRGWPCRSR
jgi:hypothetical protein